MTPSLTDQLCTQCGLCCDGTLLADVELASRKEADRMELLGLEVDEDEVGHGLLPLPCSALKKKRCTIYEHRPKTCRTFECKLLQDAQRGSVTVEHALEHIADACAKIDRVKILLAECGDRNIRLPLNERCAEAVANNTGSIQQHSELKTAWSDLAALIQTTFLP